MKGSKVSKKEEIDNIKHRFPIERESPVVVDDGDITNFELDGCDSPNTTYAHYNDLQKQSMCNNKAYIGRYNIYLFYKEKFLIYPSEINFNFNWLEDDDNKDNEDYYQKETLTKFINKYFKNLHEFDESFSIYSDGINNNFWNKSCFIDEKLKLIIMISRDGAIDVFYNYYDERIKAKLDKIKEYFKKGFLKLKNKKNKYHISFLLQSPSGLYLRDSPINYYKQIKNIDIQELYELDIKKLIDSINEDKSGVYIFDGKPGSGKTGIAKYLSFVCKDKKFIFIPNNIAHCLANPEMLEILIENPNSILILEDAEEIVLSQDGERSTGLATLLNIADGIMGDCLKIKIIVTFNNLTSSRTIDKALLRKGRLLGEFKINELSIEKTKNLMKKLYDIDVDKSMTLAEIFNYKLEINNDENNEKGKESKKVGFVK